MTAGGRPAEVAVPPGRGARESVARTWGAFVRRPASGAAVGTAMMFALFSFLAHPHFLTLPSMASTLTIAAELGIVAMGMTLLMIGGSSTSRWARSWGSAR